MADRVEGSAVVDEGDYRLLACPQHGVHQSISRRRAFFGNIAQRRMWAEGQLKPQAEADLRHTFAEGLYFQNKPSTRGLMATIIYLGRH